MKIDKNFWGSKNILVTGATGFIGSWLTETLVSYGADVTVFVKKDDPFGIDAIKHLTNKIKIKYGDLRNKESLFDATKDKEIIFHLAAITQVLYSIKNPGETIDVNVNGTLNILESIRKSDNDPFLVFASTDKVYGEPRYNPINEEHSLNSKSPYDASKVAADRLVHAYNISYGLKNSIVRWSNTYGGRDANILRAVPDFVTSLLNNKSPIIRGNGKPIRDYMYVTDAVSGILSVAQNYRISNGDVFNLGTERPTSVKELAELTIKTFNYEKKFKPIILGKSIPGEINAQYLSSKKAREKLNWEPKVDLERGLKETIKWYKENLWWQDIMRRVADFYNIKI